MYRVLVALGAYVLIGCATMLQQNPHSLYIKGVEWPLTEIRAVAASQLPIGQSSVSSNGRELRSKYFYPAKDEYKDGENSNDRYFVEYTILGDQRPYDVEVSVVHERKAVRDGGVRYIRIGHDDRLTRELYEKLRTELTKRREDRNIIDDFRVY